MLDTTMIEKGDVFADSENGHHYETDPTNHYEVVELSYITIDEMVLQTILSVKALAELNTSRVTAGLPVLTDIPTLLVKDIFHRLVLIEHRYKDLLSIDLNVGNYLKFKELLLQRYSSLDEAIICEDYAPTVQTIDLFESIFHDRVSGVN